MFEKAMQFYTMKKKSIIKISLVFIVFVFLSGLFNLVCPIFDKIFIEPSIELEDNNYTLFNKESCSKNNSSQYNIIACNIFKQSEFNENYIIKAVGNKYKFKETFITSQLGITSIVISIIMPSVYDVYDLKYSTKYKAKWSYSYLSPIKNFQDISKRLAIVMLTPSIFNNNLLIKKGNELIILTETKNGLLVRRIYGDVEEMLVFLK